MPLTNEQREAVTKALTNPREFYFPLLQRLDFELIRNSNALSDTTRETLLTDPADIQRNPFPFQAFGDLPYQLIRTYAAPESWDSIYQELERRGIFCLKPAITDALGIDDPGVPSTQAVLRDNLPIYKDLIGLPGGSVELYNFYVAAVCHANIIFRHMVLGELPACYQRLGFDRVAAVGLVQACAIDDNDVGLSVYLDSREHHIPTRLSGLAPLIPEYSDEAVMEAIILCDAPRCAKLIIDRLISLHGSSANFLVDNATGSDPSEDEDGSESDASSGHDSGSESESDRRDDEEDEEDDEDGLGLRSRTSRGPNVRTRADLAAAVAAANKGHSRARAAVEAWIEVATAHGAQRVLRTIQDNYPILV
jgi:hypothetical protein